MKNFKILASSLLGSLLLFSCNQDTDDVTVSETPEQVTTNATNIPTEVAAKLSSLGYNLANVERKELTFGDVTLDVWSDEDAYITTEDLEKVDLSLNQEDSEDFGKAFVRNSRINTNQGTSFNGIRYVSVGVLPEFEANTGRPIPTSAGVRRALERAVNTLNNIGSRIFFVIQPAGTGNELNFSASITRNGTLGGFAPTPVNGNFGSAFGEAFAPNERDLGAIFMHEMMHAMGFRHSDFQNRESCRLIGRFDLANRDEPQGDANFVAGTNGNRRNINSVLTACYIGNFNLFQEDINAIRSIYGR